MKLKHLFALLALLPFAAGAQNCIKPFSANCWFNQVGYVRISDDGSRILAWGGYGPSANSNATSCGSTNITGKVYRFTDSGMVYFAGQSGPTGYTAFSDFTKKNGIFYGQEVNGAAPNKVFFYRTANGTAKTVAGGNNYPCYSNEILPTVGNSNKMIVRNGNYNKAYFLSDADTSNPTITTITLPGPSQAADCGWNVIAASFADNRIYYVSTEGGGSTLSAPYRRQIIKACDTTGAAIPGWNDVVIQRGHPWGIYIRPTDGRVFVRLIHNSYHFSFHGVVVFDKFGNLSTDMNMTDLSMMGGSPSGGSSVEHKIYFDNLGNIYANKWVNSDAADMNGNAMGLMRFDPNGNIDLGFARNAWNSYGMAENIGASSFDISNGGVIIKANVANLGGTSSSSYPLSPTHVNSNNEDPTNTYSFLQSSINNWGTYSLFRNGSNSNYQMVQFLFSNGRLILPNMTVGEISSNCGITTPAPNPPKSPAAGTIQCNSLAFITAPVQGTPSTLVIKVPINVTTIGNFWPITVSGSGMSMQDPYLTLNATTTGVTDFYVTLKYDGSALGTFNISVGNAGSCTANLSDQTKNNPSVVPIWTPENCTYKVIGPDLK